MRIYLIGYMGCGKSTIARSLASKLGIEYVDLDRYVSDKQGQTVEEIFQEHGEEYFRELETSALEDLATVDNIVISTGGGTPCFNDNMTFIKNAGVSIYLKVDPNVLINRLLISHTVRPLILNKSPEELNEYITMSLAMREPFYEQANVTIANPSRDVTKIIEILSYYRNN